MPSPHPCRRTYRLRRLVAAAACIALTLAGVAVGLIWAARWSPPFYRQAMQQPIAAALVTEAHEELSSCLLDVYNRRWEGAQFVTRIRQQTLNAVLAGDIPERFSAWWPPRVRQMRVVITPDRVQVGMHYRLGPLTTVVWAEGEIYLTPHDNELAVRLHRVRLGAIPLPPAAIFHEIHQSSQQAGLIVRWSEAAQEPVLLLRPAAGASSAEDQPRIVLEQLSLQEGAMLLAGRWVRPEASSAAWDSPAAARDVRGTPPRDAPSSTGVDHEEGVSSVHPTLQAR